MQQRRYRPGDVLDDYCPRERRITDHAIVAMIDEHIKQTRCVVCDAEHEYKAGKAPPQRRKKPQAALFAQVLDGVTGPQPPARPSMTQAAQDEAMLTDNAAEPEATPLSAVVEPVPEAKVAAAPTTAAHPPSNNGDAPPREEGLWRRQLIRAALPRPEGQQPPATRPAPDFTIRQPNTSRGHRHGRRRGGGGFAANGNGNQSGARFGRGAQGHGQGGRRRRRGKKNS